MTHETIMKKFMIEYDKANVTSAYPSLTKYEIATVLDKAYLALISQKITGTNFRKAAFESDIKAVEDVRPLITRNTRTKIADYNPLTNPDTTNILVGKAKNEVHYSIPSDCFYVISGRANVVGDKYSPANVMSIMVMENFLSTDTNEPWIPLPVLFLEDKNIIMMYDYYSYQKNPGTLNLVITYIKKPSSFVDSVSNNKLAKAVFELNNEMAEELINLAIIMSLEIVESQRLSSKTQTSQLES